MMPASSITSTEYALADEGQEYVVFQPDGGDLTVQLPAGTFGAEWFGLEDRSWTDGDAVTHEETGATRLRPPSASGAWVLHLRRQSRPATSNSPNQ